MRNTRKPRFDTSGKRGGGGGGGGKSKTRKKINQENICFE